MSLNVPTRLGASNSTSPPRSESPPLDPLEHLYVAHCVFHLLALTLARQSLKNFENPP